MFDIGGWEFMIVLVVMLLVVGPKELPAMLRTIGKYAGMLKKQAREFRAQFDEAIQESEFQDLKKDVENLGEEAESSLRDTESTVRDEMSAIDEDFDKEVNLDDDAYDDDQEDAAGSSAAGKEDTDATGATLASSSADKASVDGSDNNNGNTSASAVNGTRTAGEGTGDDNATVESGGRSESGSQIDRQSDVDSDAARIASAEGKG